MKDDLIGIFIYCLIVACIFLVVAFAVETMKNRFENATGNQIENMENLKRDCEKSLPRDKVCVMVFDYVPVENDYDE